MKIYDIFLTLQGESSFAGLPSIIVRLGECNLRCSYCDTIYAYEYKYEYTIDEVMDKIKNFSSIKNVLITGGEPLLQKQEVIRLTKKLFKQKYSVFIETNGSIPINGIPKRTHIILDMKTPSSGECNKNYFKNLSYLSKRDELKFVIGDETDYNWAKDIIRRYEIKVQTILFSPVYDILDAKQLGEWILRDKLNVRLQMQIHKILNIK